MKPIEEYRKEELIALFKKLSVYATTWWFKYYRMYKMKQEDKERPIIECYRFPWSGYSYSPSRVIAYIKTTWKSNERTDELYQQLLPHNTISFKITKLAEDRKKNSNKIMKLQCERAAFLNVYRSIWWCGGEMERYVELYDRLEEQEDWESPENLEIELHMNDDYNKENGIATDYEVYVFVWNTLQYLNIKQLSKLLKFADNGIETKWQKITITAGRKSKVCTIQQIDTDTGAVINTYTTRNEIMAKTDIKKSHLSQCIKTAKDNPNDRTKWKKWFGSDGRKYGFAELQ